MRDSERELLLTLADCVQDLIGSGVLPSRLPTNHIGSLVESIKLAADPHAIIRKVAEETFGDRASVDEIKETDWPEDAFEITVNYKGTVKELCKKDGGFGRRLNAALREAGYEQFPVVSFNAHAAPAESKGEG